MLIDAEWNIAKNACYSRDRLQKLYDRPMSLLEVLTRQDGEWANVATYDRTWVASKYLSEEHLIYISQKGYCGSSPAYLKQIIKYVASTNVD